MTDHGFITLKGCKWVDKNDTGVILFKKISWSNFYKHYKSLAYQQKIYLQKSINLFFAFHEVTLLALASFLIFTFWPNNMVEEFDGSEVYHSCKKKRGTYSGVHPFSIMTPNPVLLVSLVIVKQYKSGLFFSNF